MIPIADRIIVERDPSDEKTQGGLIIPDTARSQSDEATVVAVGPGKLEDGKRVPMDCAVGDKVIIAKYAGTEIQDNGQVLWLMREADVLAVLATP